MEESIQSQWINENLSRLLNFQVPPDLIEYIMSINNENDLQEYVKTLLDFNNTEHCDFYLNLLRIKQGNLPKKNNSNKQQAAKENIPAPEQKDNKKRKTKFVGLYSAEGKSKEIIQLKGRHKCDCEASKHKLINNCLSCGRIVCDQEGSGPCLFCNNLVCTPEEQAIIDKKTKRSGKLYEQLMDKGLDKAMAHRNQLLEFDKTSERRTRVIDDESDHFAVNAVWLNPEERKRLEVLDKKAQEIKHASRRNKKFTIDFSGREVHEDNSATIDKLLNENFEKSIETTQSIQNPDKWIIETLEKLNEVRDPDDRLDIDFSPRNISENGRPRVQDRALLEMTDSGLCLSLHQPYASLLVDGIKCHEGRTWYTSHRGRLWIASASYKPTNEQIETVENFYREYYKSKGGPPPFPSSYPTGCLLGCVHVTDCLALEDYRERYPDGESESPYVLICEDSRSLTLRFPITGKNKIYKLDTKIHNAAKNALKKITLY